MDDGVAAAAGDPERHCQNDPKKRIFDSTAGSEAIVSRMKGQRQRDNILRSQCYNSKLVMKSSGTLGPHEASAPSIGQLRACQS